MWLQWLVSTAMAQTCTVATNFHRVLDDSKTKNGATSYYRETLLLADGTEVVYTVQGCSSLAHHFRYQNLKQVPTAPLDRLGLAEKLLAGTPLLDPKSTATVLKGLRQAITEKKLRETVDGAIEFRCEGERSFCMLGAGRDFVDLGFSIR